MCDCPATSVFVTHESVKKGWFIYAECRTEDGSNNPGPTFNEPDHSTSSTQQDEELDNMYMFLDPNLRPITPDLNEPESRHIYEEHKELAEEYLKVQKDIAILYEEKQKLVEKQTDEQLKERQGLLELINERESLMKLYEGLKTQLQLLQENAPAPTDQGEWVVVPRHSEGSGS